MRHTESWSEGILQWSEGIWGRREKEFCSGVNESGGGGGSSERIISGVDGFVLLGHRTRSSICILKWFSKELIRMLASRK